MEEQIQSLPSPSTVGRGARVIRGLGREQIDLNQWLNPEVPGPTIDVGNEDDDGWKMIDRIGAWECGLALFPAMEVVPTRHREVWARAVTGVMRSILSASEGSVELDRALKWWLVLPQALLRQTRRGGNAGRSLVGSTPWLEVTGEL